MKKIIIKRVSGFSTYYVHCFKLRNLRQTSAKI